MPCLSRTFSLEDQSAFAALSGDFNPIHVDPLLARRLLFGAPVVHGVALLLWGLESGWPSGRGRASLAEVECRIDAGPVASAATLPSWPLPKRGPCAALGFAEAAAAQGEVPLAYSP